MATRVTDMKYYGFSTTQKLHKIHKYSRDRGRRYVSRYPMSKCGTTSLHNLQDEDLNTESYNLCKSCFGLRKKAPVTLMTTLRKNDPDRLSWIQRMGIPIR